MEGGIPWRVGMPTRCGRCLSEDIAYSEDGSARCHACGAVSAPSWKRAVEVSIPESGENPLPGPALPSRDAVVAPRPLGSFSRWAGPVIMSSPTSSLRQAAGWLAIVGGAMLVFATPLTMLLLTLIIPTATSFFALFCFCGTAINGLVGALAVKFGRDALQGHAEGGAGLIAGGVIALVGVFFLLGGVLGLLAGILLLVAGAFLYSAERP